MKSIKDQRGLSIWMTLILLICFAFMGLIALKLGPVYLESIKIDRGLENLLNDEDVKSMSKTQIRDALVRRLDIDSVERVNFKNFFDVVTIEKDLDAVVIDVSYEAVVPIAANVSALVEFEKSVRAD